MKLSKNGKYEIKEVNGRMTCTCRDFKYRHAATTHGVCKHIKESGVTVSIEDTRYKPAIVFERTVVVINEMLKDSWFKICGSYRRGATKLKDLDVVVQIDPKELTDLIGYAGEVIRGGDKAVTAVFDSIQVDFKIVKKSEHFWSMVMHFTGSKEENIRLRRIAKSKGLKLNEYGIEGVEAETERDIYAALGEEFKEPCQR